MNMLTMALCYIDPLSNECSVDLTDKIWLGFFQTCNIKARFYFVSSKKVLILALDLSGIWCVVYHLFWFSVFCLFTKYFE